MSGAAGMHRGLLAALRAVLGLRARRRALARSRRGARIPGVVVEPERSDRSSRRPALRRDARGAPLCDACGLCPRACPADALEIASSRGEDGRTRLEAFHLDATRCLGCGLCVAICPALALATAPLPGPALAREDLVLDLLASEGRAES